MEFFDKNLESLALTVEQSLESDFSFFKKSGKIKNSKNNLKKLDFRGDSYIIIE